MALRLTRAFGKCTLLGEGSQMLFSPTHQLIHMQKQIQGSWASPVWQLDDLFERLLRWNIHPQTLVTHTFSIHEADSMFRLMVSDQCGKVAVVFD